MNIKILLTLSNEIFIVVWFLSQQLGKTAEGKSIHIEE